jgi:hypothetical protein
MREQRCFSASFRHEKDSPRFKDLISARAASRVIVVVGWWGGQSKCESWWGDPIGDPIGDPARMVTVHGTRAGAYG